MLTALYADANGTIYDAPGYQAVASDGSQTVLLRPDDMILLPDGAELMYLPARTALMNRGGRTESLATSLYAVAAMLPAGYTRTYLPAFSRQKEAPLLPLYGYTAAALYKDEIVVAAVKTSDNAKWHPRKYNTPGLANKIAAVKRDLGEGRLVSHLAHCSLEWHCCTAQNLFYRRWECGIPVSPACNAHCLGCISLQPSECCPSPQGRIAFRPTAGEIAAIGAYHLTVAPDAIVSFGQGCEGEPSLAADTISEAISLMRRTTARGIINMNTNAGYTDGIRQIVDAGLDSMRVSMISALHDSHQAYYRADYNPDDVADSILYARKKGVRVSLNMLLFPGVNDRPEACAAWISFLRRTGVTTLPLRNLNIDPDWLLEVMPPAKDRPMGVHKFLANLAASCPGLTFGSFTTYEK